MIQPTNTERKTTIRRPIAPRRIAAAIAIPMLLGAALASSPASATWVDDNCKGSAVELSGWSRAYASAYAQQAVDEGYEWGGGCYKLNDRDDTPNLATDGSGEGADCSGFVFKSWALHQDGSPGYRRWDHDKDIHGPFSTWGYLAPRSGDPFKELSSKSYGATTYMDAFVWRATDYGHIAMVHAEGSGGFDYVIHARNNDVGTTIDYIDYRSLSASKAITRKAWSPECFPKCPTLG